jgi:hypothetical protein
MFLCLSVYWLDGGHYDLKCQDVFWQPDLKAVDTKVKVYKEYKQNESGCHILVTAEIRTDDTNRLVATYDSSRTYPWHLAVHTVNGQFVSFKEYKTAC